MDEPTDLPEGTVLDVMPGLVEDDLDDEDPEALENDLRVSFEQSRLGLTRPADEVLAELRASRPRR